jgi:hypothetical protein
MNRNHFVLIYFDHIPSLVATVPRQVLFEESITGKQLLATP